MKRHKLTWAAADGFSPGIYGTHAEVVFDCSGNVEAIKLALSVVMRGGTIMLYGVCHRDHDVAVNPFWINDAEITIRGSYNNPNTMSRALDLLISGRLNAAAVATHRYPLERGLEAFKAAGSDECLKVLVEPGGGMS